MYRNRSTGELKGDGLIVFGSDDTIQSSSSSVSGSSVVGGGTGATNESKNEKSGIDLIETVCMQMNGAELPCGTVIGVELADMDWGRRKDEKKFKMMDCLDHVQGSTTTIATTTNGEGEDLKQVKGESMKGNEEEEELDDFFASLE